MAWKGFAAEGTVSQEMRSCRKNIQAGKAREKISGGYRRELLKLITEKTVEGGADPAEHKPTVLFMDFLLLTWLPGYLPLLHS